MAKAGMKIKGLAREFGVSSRAGSDRCRAEGLFIHNSITKVDSQQEARIRAWFKDVATQPDSVDQRSSAGA